MESTFREHMIKCVILHEDNKDQCIISTDFLAHPDIQAILNFKVHYIKIHDVKLPLKVIASVCPHMELFLNAVNDNLLEEIPEAERVSFYDDKSDNFSQTEEIKAEQAIRPLQPSPHQPPPPGSLRLPNLLNQFSLSLKHRFPFCHTASNGWPALSSSQQLLIFPM
uniref:Uncharacterized protein n=1 Tax=Romanomermis culicivorax TaxID=13658 RepID=A0A915HYZ3_ROMCU